MTVPDLTNPIFPMIYAGAGASLAEAGYALVIGSDKLLVDGDDAAEPNGQASGVFLDDRVDGWIITDALLDSKLPDAFSRDKVPVVLVLRRADSIDAPSIAPDDKRGIELVVRHLVELGHTAIAHVAGPARSSSGSARRRSFVDCMRSYGLDVPDAAIVHADAFRADSGREACGTLLESGEQFTAIVAADDLIALGCYDALAERAIAVPGEMSVTGFDDMAFIDRVNPPLTTVSVPFYEMGAAAGRVMLSLLTDREAVAQSVDEASAASALSLVVRSSTAPPSAAGS
jgi:LacI family transcriptional regulator